jgi:hypothetical protein
MVSMAKQSSNSGIVFAAVALAVIIGAIGIYMVLRQPATPSTTTPGQVACTLEAKLCPDGSSVGRTGPNCEFAQCPGSPAPAPSASLKTFTDAAKGVTFQYPALTTAYISGQTWPPTVQVKSGPFSCATGGSEIAQGGVTASKTIDGKTYCVTTSSEGAAGSVYTTYDYASEVGGKVVTLSFVLQFVQCANYDEPKKTACEAERLSFSPDGLIAEIAPTIKLTK